ncbi:16 kDa calcium-binding protein [Taenia crassiceps]|uniref:16 kDa calcium-binding protein n=1 Tax=Taenia crassiceps TaxID=6207 RepID=A0ABR4QE33_9CEST
MLSRKSYDAQRKEAACSQAFNHAVRAQDMGLTHRYLEAFKAADKDNSGTLTRGELQSVLASKGIPLSEIDNLMNQLDINGDGIISLGEYKIALGISTQPLEAWRQLFEELDKDGSGTIEVAELKLFLEDANMESLIPVLDDWIGDYDAVALVEVNILLNQPIKCGINVTRLALPDSQLSGYSEESNMSSQRHRYLKAFKSADKDGSGSLDRQELAAALASQGIPASETEKLMDSLDINGDGIIHLGEYEIALGISTQPIEAWKQLFAELDTDHSGVIDFNELCNYLNSSGGGEYIPILKDWMEDYDVNKDGKLSCNEFLGFVSSLEN